MSGIKDLEELKRREQELRNLNEQVDKKHQGLLQNLQSSHHLMQK